MKNLIEIIQRPKISLRWKLLGGFLASNILLLVALGFAMANLFNSSEALKTLKTGNERTQLVNQIELAQSQMTTSVLDYVWSKNLSRLNDYEIARARMSRALANFQPRPLQQDNYNLLKSEVNSFYGLLDQTIKLDSSAGEEQAKFLWRNQASKQANRLRGITDELTQQELHAIEIEYQETTDQIDNSAWLIRGIVLIALLLAISLALLQTAALTDPIRRLRRSLTNLAAGDLTQRLEIVNRDELGELSLTYNSTLTSLRTLIHQLYQQSQQVSAATEKLSSQARQQVAGSSQQASAITEATQVLQELSQTAELIAGQTLRASEAVNFSLERANSISSLAEAMVVAQEQGRTTVADTIESLYNLKEQVSAIQAQQEELLGKSDLIRRVIALIDSIAKEIHLLALNAAIEARGAGAYGERFAVIAGQVKQLANRSVEATQEVRSALGGISQAVAQAEQQAKQGLEDAQVAVKKAGKSDQVLLSLTSLSEQVKAVSYEIVAQVQDTATLTTNIGVATRQQQVASHQMLEKMLEIETVTVQNLGSIKQGEAATTQLSLSAYALGQSADAFKLVV